MSFVKTFCGFLTAIRLQGNFSLLALVYFVVMPVRAVVRSSSWCFLMFFVDPKGAKTETASCSQVSVCCVPCFPLIYLVFSLPAPQADGGSVACLYNREYQRMLERQPNSTKKTLFCGLVRICLARLSLKNRLEGRARQTPIPRFLIDRWRAPVRIWRVHLVCSHLVVISAVIS